MSAQRLPCSEPSHSKCLFHAALVAAPPRTVSKGTRTTPSIQVLPVHDIQSTSTLAESGITLPKSLANHLPGEALLGASTLRRADSSMRREGLFPLADPQGIQTVTVNRASRGSDVEDMSR